MRLIDEAGQEVVAREVLGTGQVGRAVAVNIDNVTEGVIRPRPSDIVVEPDKPKLSMEQIAEIEKNASEVWPATEKKPKLTEVAITRICRAYKANALSEIDAERYPEIMKRIEEARAQTKAKAEAQS